MALKQEQLKVLLAPTVAALGCELWGLEYISQGKYSTLRIYIDAENGVSLEDCERVSRQISSVLDVEDPIHGEYSLEVSSPGLDRPLYTLAQFAKYVGEAVSVKLRVAFDGRRKFNGTLRAVEGDEIVVVVDDHEYLLPLESIDRANIIPRF